MSTTTTLPKVTVQLPSDTAYWGPTATATDADRILTRLEEMIRAEFEDRVELVIERTEVCGTGIWGMDDAICDEIHEWIGANWQAAL